MAESPYMTEKEAAAYLRVGVGSLQAWRRAGNGPRYRKHGALVLYHVSALDEWSLARERSSTSAPPVPVAARG